MNARLLTLTSDAKAAWASEQASGRVRINVCLDTSSIARGAEATIAAIRAAISANNLNADDPDLGIEVVGADGSADGSDRRFGAAGDR